MRPVEIVTIKNKYPLWKGEEAATNIELIEFEETGFKVVSQKDVHEVGDSCVYIQPDYCLPDIPLFESFLRPTKGNCKLGSNNRIKAIKFNFHTGNGQVVYSEGILLCYSEIQQYILSLSKNERGPDDTLDSIEDIASILKITKWESPDDGFMGGLKGGQSKPFPEEMYKTDEENVNNLWGHIEKHITYPVNLVLSEKVDGSSITIWYKNGKSGIASRNLSKPTHVKTVIGRRKKTFMEKLLFWKKVDLFLYKEELNNSDFVQIGYPYLQKLETYCKTNNLNLCLRGELSGEGLKGSGNKNNPHSKQPKDVRFYGVDIYDNNTIKLPELDFNRIVKQLDLNRCTKICEKEFGSRQEIEDYCNDYFKSNMIEGIVMRTLNSDFSTKFMNSEYDSKK